MQQEIEKYEQPQPLPALPPGVSRRKPRWRLKDRMWEIHNLKVAWLRAYTATHKIDEACAFVERDIRTFRTWLAQDPEFKAAYKEKKRQWAEVMGETLEQLDIQAADAVKDALQQTDDPRLRTETALRVLRSHGYLPDKSVVENTGPDGGPIKIVHTVEVVQPQEEE